MTPVADLTQEDWEAVDRARDLRRIANTGMGPTRTRLLSIIASAIRDLHEDMNTNPATERDLESVEFARRRLKGLSKHMKASIAANGTQERMVGLGVTERLAEARREAEEMLEGEPWRVDCTLRGVAGLHYSARHFHGEIAVHVHASSLDDLLRGIDAVALEDLDVVEDVAA